MKQLGDRIRELREEYRPIMRQEVVAAELGVSLQTVRNMEANKGINHKRLPKLAQLFGVSTDYLLGLTEERQPCIQRKTEVIQEDLESEFKPTGLAMAGT